MALPEREMVRLKGRPRQLIDGLTYELGGTDAARFDIVKATGQILTNEKLNYEIEKEYKVTVTATDPWGLSDTIPVIINVTNVTEAPVILTVRGESSHTHKENAADNTLGTYDATGHLDRTVTWSLERTPGSSSDDSKFFKLDKNGYSSTLSFLRPPNYEMPRGEAKSDSNTNTYMVTVQAQVGGETAFRDVTVVVDNEEELGTLSATGISSTYLENGTGDLGTYTLEGTAADTAKWSLGGADGSDHFMLEGTGMSRLLKFSSAPDYEMPRGAAMSATNTNTYMVTVQAEAGGEMKMLEVTVMVTDEDELGTLQATTARSTSRTARWPWEPTRSRAPLPTRPNGVWAVLTAATTSCSRWSMVRTRAVCSSSAAPPTTRCRGAWR